MHLHQLINVQLMDGTGYNALAGSVDIQVVAAELNEDNPDIANFLSIMKVNIAEIQKAGLTHISCGSFSIMATRLYKCNIQFK